LRAVFRDERGADLAAELGSDRDRLEIRARRRKAPRRGDGLVDRRVQTPCALVDQRRQRAEIGVEELGELTPLLDHRHELVLAADRSEDARGPRAAALAAAPA